MPEELSAPDPSGVAPSLNITEPVGVFKSPDGATTVAVSVTLLPTVTGLGEAVKLVVEASTTGGGTVTVKTCAAICPITICDSPNPDPPADSKVLDCASVANA